MYQLAKKKSLRVDGRSLDQVRTLDVQMSLLPKVHGSALFTRGETQAIATTTLGDKGEKTVRSELTSWVYTRKSIRLRYYAPSV